MKKNRIVMVFMVGVVAVSFIALLGCPLFTLTAPTGFTLEEESAGSVVISWESGHGEGTIVERSYGSEGGFAELGRVDHGGLGYTDNEVAGGCTYSYRIAHYRGENAGEWSEEKSITTGGITELTLGIVLEGVSVAWKGGSGDGTVVERRKKDGDFEEIARTETVGTYYDDLVGMERAAEYSYRVASYRGDHTGSWSEEKSITIPHANPLEPPDWIQGTWNNGNITYEFTSDNVTHTDSSTSQTIDFQEQNDYFAEEGAEDTGYFDSEPDHHVYIIELKNNGSVQDTYTFDDNWDGTLEYTVASTGTITLTKQ